MFETEPILWLQAAASPPLTGLLLAVSLLGLSPVYALLLLGLGFLGRLRPCLAVFVATILAALLVSGLKAWAALPRPDEVDARVRSLDLHPTTALVARGGAPDFCSLPSKAAIAAVRGLPLHDYGFPSGHVAGATAVSLALALFFRSRAALAIAGIWVPAVALSRLYLGRHFLGDVLGGLAVGAAATALAVPLVRLLEAVAFAQRDRGAIGPAVRGRRTPWRAAALAVLVLGLAPFVSSLHAGALAGVGLTYSFLAVVGAPAETGDRRERLARTAMALGLFGLGALACWGRVVDFAGLRPSALAAGFGLTFFPLTLPMALTHARQRRPVRRGAATSDGARS